MTRVSAIGTLDAANYQRSDLHSNERIWIEKNCYVDIWIEVIHALGLEPKAMLGFVLGLDFEGDQWTFFKPVHDELRLLYGIDVQELNVWRPLIDHSLEHLAERKLISTEADAFWLPDTSGTDYRKKHTKTTIVIESIDVSAGNMGYFHNASYHTLDGEDFRRTFRLDAAPDPEFLPLFAEFIRIDRLAQAPAPDIASTALDLLKKHVQRRPETNPVRRFEARFLSDLPALQAAGIDHYHAWAFATIRQLGAAFELAAAHLEWLTRAGQAGLEVPTQDFALIASNCKAIILKGARAVITRKQPACEQLFSETAAAWERGFANIERAL